MKAVTAGLAGLALALATAGGASAATWTAQQANTVNDLRGVSCATVTTCVAVGAGGTIRTTLDGGEIWEAHDSGTSTWYGVSCGTTATCVTVGAGGWTAQTLDGGRGWTRRPLVQQQPQDLEGVSCATATSCTAVGAAGTIVTTTDAGSTWTGRQSGTTAELGAVSCPTANVCYAVGQSATILRTVDGGLTWTRLDAPTQGHYWGVSCADAVHCWAVGIYETIVSSDGVNWTVDRTGGTSTLDAVSCSADQLCVAGGGFGTLFSKARLSDSWSRESSGTAAAVYGISCPAGGACWAVGGGGTVVTSTADVTPPSDDCTAPTTTVLDGYVGSVYGRLEVQRNATETWVCTRLQLENGQELAGGKLVAGPDGTPAAVDSQSEACAAQTGSAHLTGGDVGDPGDPGIQIPYSLDTWSTGDESWVCMRAGIGARAVLSPGVFERDGSSAPAPPRVPWTPGAASAECESQVGGARTRVVNAVVGGVQVWVTGWQSGSRTLLCVRAQGGGSSGGRLLLDATGTPGVQPVTSVGFDASGCTVAVFSNDSAELAIRRSPTGVSPASVCVTRGTSTIRLTAGYTGTPLVPNAGWKADG
jgi:photosystem II stability/assembly factor-like uncharacterized protein